MPILECPDIFELVLPDGFRVLGEPGRYDIEGPEGTGLGMNITVYPESDQLLQEGSINLLTAFVGSAGGNTEGLQIDAPMGSGGPAFTSFSKEDSDWCAGIIYLPNGVVLASATTAPGNEAIHIGKQLIASIYPVMPRRRGLFRRR